MAQERRKAKKQEAPPEPHTAGAQAAPPAAQADPQPSEVQQQAAQTQKAQRKRKHKDTQPSEDEEHTETANTAPPSAPDQPSDSADSQPPQTHSGSDYEAQPPQSGEPGPSSEDLEGSEPGPSEDPGNADGEQPRRKKKRKVLDEERLKRLKEEYDKRGVIYVSRIPPHMKPMKLKQLLSQYGETLRVYCTPEDPRARKLRKQKGGNTGKNFTEGWVEFADKRVAKRVANAINGQRIGGKRRSAYYDDLWVVKYLKHFKWDHLTEEIAYQRAVREQRLAAEISAAKKERDHYLAQVDKSKALAAMEGRRAAKQANPNTHTNPTTDTQTAPTDTPVAPSAGTKAHADGGARDAATAGGAAARSDRYRTNRDLGQRVPRPDPAQGGVGDRELADDVLMMVARRKKSTV